VVLSSDGFIVEVSAFSSCLILFPRILALTYEENVSERVLHIAWWLNRWSTTYVSYMHSGALDSKFFANLVLFECLL